jgi:hypothetical protein
MQDAGPDPDMAHTRSTQSLTVALGKFKMPGCYRSIEPVSGGCAAKRAVPAASKFVSHQLDT